MDPAPVGPDDGLESGAVLDGRYRIDGVIGGGGMARVYRAEHLGITRPVAIKVLHAVLTRNHEAVARFRLEATASGRLVHPNIVTVTDFGVLPDGRCFLVMEALEGETLADRLEREGKIPWPDAVTILEELLRGLGHAHRNGVIHRDIKPENIFLLRGDGRPLVKILDFGIAKLYEGLSGEGRITQDGATIGTPLYMSPEQTIDGEITPATDLYSSTVVLFEMLTGRPPFYGKDRIATMRAHLRDPQPGLRDRAPGLDVPDELEGIVRRGLAKLAVDRMPSADAYLCMLADLDAADAAEPRERRPVTPPPPVERDRDTELGVTSLMPARPRRWRWGVAGALLLAGIAIPVTYRGLRSPRAQRPDPPPAPLVTARTPAPDVPAPALEAPEPPEAGSAAGRDADTPPPRDRQVPRADAGSSAGSDAASAAAAEAERARDRAQVQRWVTEGNLALAAGRFDEAGARFQRALAADGAAHAAHAGLADVAYHQGDFTRAMLSALRAVALAPGVVAYRMTLAKAYYKLLRYDDAIAQWQRVLELEPSNARARGNIDQARSRRGP